MKENLDLTGDLIFQNEFYSNKDVKQNIEKYKKLLSQNIDYLSKNKPIIGIYLERSPEMIFVISALFEMKIPFLMLDVNHPFKRIELMLENADVSIVVSSKNNAGIFSDKKVISVDKNKDEGEDKTPLRSKLVGGNGDSDIAYVLFTSGSTGDPKAVMVKRAGLINFIGSVPKIISMDNKTIIGCFTNCTFDIFFLESITALYSGATIILGGEDTVSNPIKLIKLVKDTRINMLQFTPSRLRMIQMIDENFSCLKKIKALLVGGEVLTEDLLISLQKNTNTKIFNMYGPTETTIWSTISDLTCANTVDIGKPIDNTQIYIVDKNALFIQETEIPIMKQGVVGEVCIAGDGLSKGYLNNQEQTTKSFVDVLINGVLTKIYRTGDLGYCKEDGKLVCLGRKDDQIKLNGHRIELGEIESNLLKNPEISNVAVCFDKKYNRLVAFVVPYLEQNKYEKSITIEDMNSALKEKLTKNLIGILPRYMCPSEYIFVDKLLYTSSGKLDRNALIEGYICKKETKKKVSNENQLDEVLEKIITVISNTLGKSESDISKQLELKMLSINSIQFINIVVTCEELFDIEFEDTYLSFSKFNTIGDIYDYIVSLMDK